MGQDFVTKFLRGVVVGRALIGAVATNDAALAVDLSRIVTGDSGFNPDIANVRGDLEVDGLRVDIRPFGRFRLR